MSQELVAAHAVRPLTARQREVLRVIVQFYRREGEAPSVCFIARRLGLHHSAVQDHIARLYSKGWLGSPTPAGLRCPHEP